MERRRWGGDAAWVPVCLALVGVLVLSLLLAVSFGTVSIPLGQVYGVILEELRALLPGGTAPAGGFGLGDPAV